MNIYIVLVEDRHADVDALPFDDKDEAIAYAKSLVQKYGRFPEDVQENVYDEYVYHCDYSCEGDNVAVIEREMNKKD